MPLRTVVNGVKQLDSPVPAPALSDLAASSNGLFSKGENAMESRRILKVLANGWEVPYPDEVIYRGMLLLKDYRLNDYP